MASCSFKMPEDFLRTISALGERTDEIVARVLEAGGEVVLAKVKSNLQAVIGKDTKYPSQSTGELVDALGVSPVKLDRAGNSNLKIGFSEPRSDGGSNAMIANVIEYGKAGQPPKPFLAPAKSAANASLNALAGILFSSNTSFLTAISPSAAFATPTAAGQVKLYSAPPAVTSLSFPALTMAAILSIMASMVVV